MKKEMRITDCISAKHNGKIRLELPRDVGKHQQETVTSKGRMVWDRGLVVK